MNDETAVVHSPLLDDPAFKLAYAVAANREGVKDFDLEVAKEMNRIRFIASENSLTSRLHDAVRIRCIILSVAYEDNSKRYVITFRADNSDKDETIRSERINSRRGDLVQKLWGPGTDRVNKRAIIYKSNEGVGESAGASHGYRVAPYATFLTQNRP